MLPFKKFEFSGVKGINKLSLTFNDSRMNVLIGNNGVGKTKALESLFQSLFFTCQMGLDDQYGYKDLLIFDEAILDGDKLLFKSNDYFYPKNTEKKHRLPIVFVSAMQRGIIPKKEINAVTPLEGVEERKKLFLEKIIKNMRASITNDVGLEEWFVQRMLSSNSFSPEDDNRIVEIETILNILHKVDSRIDNSSLFSDKKPLLLHGGKSVSIKIDGEYKFLNELSSGFASLVRIIQTIISGYAFFTNAKELDKVEGVVLIDEIESHLHIEWQAKILPLLIKVFPRTTFIVTTHSSLVLAQLVEGEAYRLEKENGIVRNKLMRNPRTFILDDLIQDAFQVNMNKLKIETESNVDQDKAKKALLELLNLVG